MEEDNEGPPKLNLRKHKSKIDVETDVKSRRKRARRAKKKGALMQKSPQQMETSDSSPTRSHFSGTTSVSDSSVNLCRESYVSPCTSDNDNREGQYVLRKYDSPLLRLKRSLGGKTKSRSTTFKPSKKKNSPKNVSNIKKESISTEDFTSEREEEISSKPKNKRSVLRKRKTTLPFNIAKEHHEDMDNINKGNRTDNEESITSKREKTSKLSKKKNRSPKDVFNVNKENISTEDFISGSDEEMSPKLKNKKSVPKNRKKTSPVFNIKKEYTTDSGGSNKGNRSVIDLISDNEEPVTSNRGKTAVLSPKNVFNANKENISTDDLISGNDEKIPPKTKNKKSVSKKPKISSVFNIKEENTTDSGSSNKGNRSVVDLTSDNEEDIPIGPVTSNRGNTSASRKLCKKRISPKGKNRNSTPKFRNKSSIENETIEDFFGHISDSNASISDITLVENSSNGILENLSNISKDIASSYHKENDSESTIKSNFKSIVQDPLKLQDNVNKSVKKQSKSPIRETIQGINLDVTFTTEDPLKTALKEFKFVSQEEDRWTDGNNHVFNSNDIEDQDDEKRGTYNLEKSVIGLDTLRAIRENNLNTSSTPIEKKRSSIGQRISQQKGKQRSSPPPKQATAFKAKTKTEKSHLPGIGNKTRSPTTSTPRSVLKNNSVFKSLLNKSNKNVTFNESMASVNLSKIKRTKMPDFTRIHQRQLERTESITDYVERTKERARVLLSGSKPTNISSFGSENSTKKKNMAQSSTLETERSQKCRKQLEFKRIENNYNASPKVPLLSKEKSKLQTTGSLTNKSFGFNRLRNIAGTSANPLPNKEPTESSVQFTNQRSNAIDVKSPKKANNNKTTPKKKSVTYVTPEKTNKSSKMYAKTPGKDILGKKPIKIPKKDVPIDSHIQPSTSSALSPRKPLGSSQIQHLINKQVPSKKTYISHIPKKPPTKVNIKSDPTTMTRRNALNPTTSTLVKDKENKSDVGYSKFGFKIRPNKEALKAAVNKTRIPKAENIEEKRNALKGVRLNKRFDLLMKLRKK